MFKGNVTDKLIKTHAKRANLNVHRFKKNNVKKYTSSQINQQYPPGTRENCGTFSSIIHVTKNGTKFEVPKGGRGPKGGPGVPPKINQRQYSADVAKGNCNSRCRAAKSNYQKQRRQYMKTFHVPCQNGHIKNTGTYNGKPLSDQGNPSGDTPGYKTTIGGYGGVTKGRPLGAPGAGQINWPNYAKYNWRTAFKSYTMGPP